MQGVENNGFIKTIREFINDNFLFGKNEDLQEDTSFLESGIIDSTGILELIAFLEEKYGITVDDEEIVPENLDSLKNLGAFLERKLAG
ncbi:MAG: acyl carrier protein [Deltaproteobacteria bacterium]|nr:acyl carrier protein [Deltaproteobacteria bacterium]